MAFVRITLLLFSGSFVHSMRLSRFIFNFFSFTSIDAAAILLPVEASSATANTFVVVYLSDRLPMHSTGNEIPNGNFAFIAFGYTVFMVHSHSNDANAKQTKKKRILHGKLLPFLSRRRWRPSGMKRKIWQNEEENRNNAMPLQCVCAMCIELASFTI